MVIKIEDMTWKEVEEYLEVRQDLILTMNSCEQHGMHLPLNTDSLVTEYMAEYLSKKTGVAIAPNFNYSINLPCDKYFSGTTSLTVEGLKKTMWSILQWWEFQGFKRFYLLTYHGDPFHVEILSKFKENVFLIEMWEIEYADILEKQSTIKHACEAETSVMLYLYPQKVKMDSVYEYDVSESEFRGYLNHEKEGKIPNYKGALGFPSFATQLKGEVIVERMKDKVLKGYFSIVEKSK